LLLAGAGIAALLLSCAHLTGGGSDQPNCITGTVIGMSRLPMPESRVRLFSGSYSPGFDAPPFSENGTFQVDSVLTGPAGQFFFERVYNGRYYIEVLSPNVCEIAVSGGFCKLGDSLINLGELRLAGANALSGTVKCTRSTLRAVEIAGTHYRVPVSGSGGAFAFPSLPDGDFRLYALFGGNDSSTAAAIGNFSLRDSSKKVIDSIIAEPDRILLYDFETGSGQTCLKGIVFPATDTLGGAWFKIIDRDIGGNSTLTPPGFPANFSSALDGTVCAYRGKSLHLCTHLGTKFTKNNVTYDPFLYTGFNLGNRSYDLSKMRELTLYAKGCGNFVVQFETDTANKGEGYFISPAICLQQGWTRISIKAADIVPQPGSVIEARCLKWPDACKKVKNIFFSIKGDTDLWLDEVYLDGVRYTDL
jgi:hypothetical protein